MKTHNPDSHMEHRQPAAVGGEMVTTQAAHIGSADRLASLQSAIDQSPRVLTQRRAIQAAFGSALQLQAMGLEDDHRSDVGAVQRNGDGAGLSNSPAASADIAVEPVNDTGMPSPLKARIEALSGMDMSGVRVHRNSEKPAQLNALAYTQGNDAHLGTGQERHLPHEAWHVVQQARGPVKATTNAMSGASVNVDATLDAEADAMGSKTLRSIPGNSKENIPLAADAPTALPSSSVAQLYAHAGYAPNLEALDVPGGGDAAYDVATFTRPAGWYEGTLDALFARAVNSVVRVREMPELAITLVQCESAGSWHNINDMQIGHIVNWQTYLNTVGPQTVREATDAYNDLNNLRLEGATANTSHDFEDGRESEDEDGSSDDDFIDKSDGGKMHPEARRGLDEYKATQSQYHRLKAGLK